MLSTSQTLVHEKKSLTGKSVHSMCNRDNVDISSFYTTDYRVPFSGKRVQSISTLYGCTDKVNLMLQQVCKFLNNIVDIVRMSKSLTKRITRCVSEKDVTTEKAVTRHPGRWKVYCPESGAVDERLRSERRGRVLLDLSDIQR